MQLYHSPTTPFGRKVMVLILESGLASQVEVVSATGTPLDPGSMPVDRNPLGKIPALVGDDGMAIYDSRVICRYLDAQSGAGLYPPEPKLWETLVLEATADGIVEAALAMAYEVRIRPADKQFPDWIEGQWAKVTRTLDAVETGWIAHLSGPLDMGQVALACALGYLDFRHGPRDWRQGRPNLSAWQKGFAARPSMQATEPPAA
jgi:glutathione S-transferase